MASRPLILLMSTLGLSGPPQQEENLFKRLLWPSVRNAHDADLLGQQGFWIAEIVALLSTVFLIVGGHPIVAVVTFVFYAFGGFGLREGSAIAAALVLTAWLADQIAGVVTHGSGIGFIPVFVTAILLANLRASILVSRWKMQPQPGDENAEPMRFSDTLVDKIRDQLPRVLWPRLRYVFYVFAVCFLAVELLGAFMLALHPHQGRSGPPPDATVSAQ